MTRRAGLGTRGQPVQQRPPGEEEVDGLVRVVGDHGVGHAQHRRRVGDRARATAPTPTSGPSRWVQLPARSTAVSRTPTTASWRRAQSARRSQLRRLERRRTRRRPVARTRRSRRPSRRSTERFLLALQVTAGSVLRVTRSCLGSPVSQCCSSVRADRAGGPGERLGAGGDGPRGQAGLLVGRSGRGAGRGDRAGRRRACTNRCQAAGIGTSSCSSGSPSTQHLAAPGQQLAWPRGRRYGSTSTFSPVDLDRRDRVSTTLRIEGSSRTDVEHGAGARDEPVGDPAATGKAHQCSNLGSSSSIDRKPYPASGRSGTIRRAARSSRVHRAGRAAPGRRTARPASMFASDQVQRRVGQPPPPATPAQSPKPATSRGFSARKLRLTRGKPGRDELEEAPRVQRVERVEVAAPGVEVEAGVHEVATDADLVLVATDQLLGPLAADGVEPVAEARVVQDRAAEDQEVGAQVQVPHVGPPARADHRRAFASSSGMTASVADVVLVELHRGGLQAPPVARARVHLGEDVVERTHQEAAVVGQDHLVVLVEPRPSRRGRGPAASRSRSRTPRAACSRRPATMPSSLSSSPGSSTPSAR